MWSWLRIKRTFDSIQYLVEYVVVWNGILFSKVIFLDQFYILNEILLKSVVVVFVQISTLGK